MTYQSIDTGGGAANPLPGSLSWQGPLHYYADSMSRDGGGNIYGDNAFSDNAVWWTVGKVGDRGVGVTLSADYGIAPYDDFVRLYTNVDNPGDPTMNGVGLRVYTDTYDTYLELWDVDGGTHTGYIVGTNTGGPPNLFDRFELLYNAFFDEFTVNYNYTTYITIPNYPGRYGAYSGIGIFNSNNAVNDVYMDVPSGGGGPWTITPAAIATSQAFGTPSLRKTVLPASIAGAQAFGTPVVSKTVNPTGIVSSQALGTASVRKSLAPSGIPSGQAFGSPIVIGGAGAGAAPSNSGLAMKGFGT